MEYSSAMRTEAGFTIKVFLLVACPPGVVTVIAPFPALVGTTKVIVVGETTVNEAAGTPPIVTELAPVRFVPVMVTVAPGAAVVGEKLVIVGAAGRTVNVVRPLVAVPPGVVILITPVGATLGTVTLTVPSRFTVNVAATPPMLTLLAPVRLLPCTVMTVPGAPDAGEKPEILGAGTVTVKRSFALADPAGDVSVSAPVTASLGTVKDMEVGLPIAVVICVAAAPPTVTRLTHCKPRPVTVTTVPGAPDVGVKLVIRSVAGVNTNPASRPVPSLVVTATSPEAFAHDTIAVICVSLSIVNEDAAVPPMLTAVAPVKRIPAITILPPGLVCVGVNERREGWAKTTILDNKNSAVPIRKPIGDLIA